MWAHCTICAIEKIQVMLENPSPTQMARGIEGSPVRPQPGARRRVFLSVNLHALREVSRGLQQPVRIPQHAPTTSRASSVTPQRHGGPCPMPGAHPWGPSQTSTNCRICWTRLGGSARRGCGGPRANGSSGKDAITIRAEFDQPHHGVIGRIAGWSRRSSSAFLLARRPGALSVSVALCFPGTLTSKGADAPRRTPLGREAFSPLGCIGLPTRGLCCEAMDWPDSQDDLAATRPGRAATGSS